MKVSISYLFLTLFLMSCYNNNEEVGSKTILESPSNYQSFSTFDPGEFHNYLVNLWMKEMKICPLLIKESAVELKDILLENSETIAQDWNFDVDEFTIILNHVNFNEIAESKNYDDIWYEKLMQSDLSINFKNTVSEFTNGLELVFDGNVNLTNIFINDFYSENISGFSGNEKMLFENLISVAKGSNKLWQNSNNGGLNGLNQAYSKLNRLCNSEQGMRRDWFKVIKADYVGVVTGAFSSLIASGGASAIPNPLLGGLPTASAIGLVTGAGASITAL